MTEGTREVGTCVVQRLDDGTRIKVLQADALIEATVELLAEVENSDGPADFSDGVLTIHGVDGDVIYRIADSQGGRTCPGDGTRMMERVS